MLENGKIAGRQFAIIVMLYTVGSAILVIPSLLASNAKQDAWLAALITLVAAVLVLPLYIALGRRFPNMTLAEYAHVILGRWFGKSVALLFLLFPFLIATLTLRNIGEFLTTQIMGETPILAIHIMMMAIVVMGVKLGLEPLTRAAELFFPWIVLLFVILVILVAPQMKHEHVQPMLEEGFKPVFKAVLSFLSFPFLEPVVLLMIFPYGNANGKAGQALRTGVLLGGIILFVITTLSVLVLGPGSSASLSFPSYELAMKINIGGFLERIEAIIAVIWFLTVFFRLSLLLYVIALGIAQVFQFKEYRFLTIPLGMMIVLFSIFEVPNTTYLLAFNQKIWPFIPLTFGLLLPLLLLAVAVIRKKDLK